MAKIIPFRGLLYNTDKVSIGDVLAPPYDIISPEFREELYQRDPYNIVRIDFGKELPGDKAESNKYERAKKYLDTWSKEGVLIQSERPSLYAYEMSYQVDGKNKKLLGFLGLVKLEELGKGMIYPHECTYSKPKQDRLNLLRICEANISPIFSLYKSYNQEVSATLKERIQSTPYLEAPDSEGSVHRLWEINEPNAIETIQREFIKNPVFIADGHHRYETSFEFHREMSRGRNGDKGTMPYDYVLMFLVDMYDEGITILPTHRLVPDIPDDIENMLARYFKIESFDMNVDIKRKLAGKYDSFGFYRNGSSTWMLLTYKGGNLAEIPLDLREVDVFILHELLLKKICHATDIGYEMDFKQTLKKVQDGQYRAAFFLNPTKVTDVEKAAISSMRMPPKSTYFYPKLLTGLVIHKW
jgi:uncharacterized protein (DUF1015 family)